jgi:hypothetical protein
MSRSRADKDDFVQLDEFDMQGGEHAKEETATNRSATQSSSGGSLTRSFTSNEDIIPLAATAAPASMNSSKNGIMVQTEFSIDRASTGPGLAQSSSDEARLMDRGRFRV